MQQILEASIIGGVSAQHSRDEELVVRAQQDTTAFGAIFDLYYAPIFTYLLKRTGDTELAEDLTAETFAKALHGIKRFTWRGVPLSSWLYRIAGNEIKQYLRGKSRRKSVSLEMLCENGFDPEAEEAVTERESLEIVLAEDKLYTHVTQTLKTLPPRYQEVLALRYMEGKEIAEIAHIMGKREGSVRSLISRGLAKLRVALEAGVQQSEGVGITTSEGRSVLSIITRNIL